MNATIHLTYKWARRIAVTLLGGSVLLVGICMIVLPGPALVVIPLGLAILGLEFAWARHWMRRMREQAQRYMPTAKAGVAGAAEKSGASSEPVAGALQPVVEAQRSSGSTSARNSSYDRTP